MVVSTPSLICPRACPPLQVLGDASKRVVYDLFGEAAVEKELNVVQIEALIGTLSFYAVWAVIAFVLTLSDAARDARAWSLAGGVLWFVLELNLIFGGASLPASFFPYMTVFEFTRVLRAAFPPFINGCRALGGYFFRSLAHENLALGVELLKSNQVRLRQSVDSVSLACFIQTNMALVWCERQAILLGMRQLQGEVASARRRPEPAVKQVKPDALPPAARKRLKMEKHPAAQMPVPAESETPAPSAENVQGLLHPEPQVQKPPAFAIPSFVYFIGFYFVMNYMFK